jgi:hypothetical protein
MSLYVKTVDLDILNATEDYIAHQCNCISQNAQALAKQIFEKFPHSNSYKIRRQNDKSTFGVVGTIEIFDNIINMYSQYYPAAAKYSNDTYAMRIIWFKMCLDKISNIYNIKNKTIAMPYNIGCGAAKGNWTLYYKMICDFAEKEQIHITLYKFNK